MYSYLADFVVALHLGYVAYVVLGQAAIVAACALNWSWGRNPYFRYSHLGMMLIVAVEAVMGWQCPLTTWENSLRTLAGQAINQSDTFMGRLFQSVLFADNKPDDYFTPYYLAFAVIVLQALVMYPPRGLRRAKSGR